MPTANNNIRNIKSIRDCPDALFIYPFVPKITKKGLVSMTKNQEKTKEALAKIESALENINSDKDWLQYLSFQSKFYRYSARNTLLIHIQNPQASYVKGYRAWNDLGRYVKKGAKGILILAPCIKKLEEKKQDDNSEQSKHNALSVLCGFTVKYVFDIADTDGSDEHLPVLVKGLSGNGEEEQALYERIRAVISQNHTIQDVTGTASKGSYNLVTGVISIREDLEYLQKIKTILHEYSHALDFKMNPDESIPRNRRELIAESSAYIVSSRLGLDTGSYTMGYLKSWSNSKDEIKTVASIVQKVSATIIDELAKSEGFAFLL